MNKTEEISFAGFLRYKNERLNLTSQWNSIRDCRKNPEVSLKTVLEAVVLGAALGDRSLRATDQSMRQSGMRKIFGCERELVVSDSTIARVCEEVSPKEIESLLRNAHDKVSQQGWSKREVQGRSVRIGVVDASGIGGQIAGFLMVLGKVRSFLALRGMEKAGYELPTTLSLLREATASYGEGYLSYVLGDGLYACTRFFETCREIGSCGVVKSDEASLSILQDANGIFDAPTPLPGVERVSDTDAVRGCSYKVWAVEDLLWSTTDIKLKVARVEETHLKGPRAGQITRFWVISQDPSLTAFNLRELGHWRWQIENNGFRSLNEQVHSKHIFSHNFQVAMVLAHLQLIGFLLMDAYRCHLQELRERLKNFFDHGSLSLLHLRNLLRSTIEFIGWNTS